MVISVNLAEQGYDIILERGALNRADELLNLNRKALIVTDSGVPLEYAKSIQDFCVICVFKIWTTNKEYSVLLNSSRWVTTVHNQ